MSQKVIYHGRDMLEQGESFVMCKIINSEGSTPRKKGACMLVREDGSTIGTVGGGKIEAETERLAAEVFKTKEKGRVFHFRLDTSEQGIGMACGGDADILIQYVDAAHPEAFEEEFEQITTAYIFGAGHVALEAEKLLRYVNFRTVVIDDREEYSNRERFPDAYEVKTIDSFRNSFEGIEIDENSYIVIVTRGHLGDLDVLRDALRLPCAYLGMIGSRNKNKVLYEALKKEGFDESEFEKVYSPIGLEIHAETPEEIAVSIAGEMINVRAGYGK